MARRNGIMNVNYNNSYRDVKNNPYKYDVFTNNMNEKYRDQNITITQETDHVYYNMQIINTNRDSYINAEFYDNRSNAIIEKPEDFEMSIIRFSIPGVTLPIFIYPNNLPTAFTANNTIYSVTLSHGGNDYQTFLTFVSSHSNATDEIFFNVGTYQQFIDIINTALQTSFTALKTAFPGVASTDAPYLIFDPLSQLFSLMVQQSYVADTIGVFFNNRLLAFFNSFNGNHLSTNTFTSPNGKDFQFTVEDTKNNTNARDPSIPVAYYKMQQNYPTLFLWNSLKSIVITTSTLPVKYEYLPNIVSGTSTSSNNNFIPIITDFEPLIQSGPELFSTVQYFPPGEYRMIDLNGNTPITQIGVRFFWSDNQGVLHPMVIPPATSATIKILFRRRGIPNYLGQKG